MVLVGPSLPRWVWDLNWVSSAVGILAVIVYIHTNLVDRGHQALVVRRISASSHTHTQPQHTRRMVSQPPNHCGSGQGELWATGRLQDTASPSSARVAASLHICDAACRDSWPRARVRWRPWRLHCSLGRRLGGTRPGASSASTATKDGHDGAQEGDRYWTRSVVDAVW